MSSTAPRIPRHRRAVIPLHGRHWYEITPLRWAATLVIGALVGAAMLGVAFIASRVFA
jgi:hypothetical protein